MRRLIVLAFVTVLVLSSRADQHSTSVTVEELQRALAAQQDAHQTDADVARQLSGMQLTERLSTAKLAHLKVGLPGEKAQQALVALADASVFLDPPAAEIPTSPMPDPAALHQMLVSIVKYVNTTVRQLPNFIATRDTTRFEDRPLEDIQGSVGMTTMMYLPLHVVGRSNVLVTYRDGHEVAEKVAAKIERGESQEQGLFTQGVFGPILSTVVGDALKGKITWSRWEEGANGTEAVFHYVVPREKSHYSVGFCCVSSGLKDKIPEPGDWHLFSEVPAYHGEIAFDPASGAILRITLEAEMLPNEVVTKNGMMVEYGAVDIGGKSYICPLRGVSVLLAHTTQPPLTMQPVANYRGPTKTFLNDAVFELYRRFGSEARILDEYSAEPVGNPAAGVAERAVSTSSKPASAANADLPKATGSGAGGAVDIGAAAAASTAASTPAPVAVVAAAAPVTAVAPPVPEEPEITIGTTSGQANNSRADQAASAALEQRSGYTLKVTSRLVDVSIVADDKKGHPVSGLKAEDVEVYDNGRRQEIKFFSSVDAVSAPAGSAAVASLENTFSNQTYSDRTGDGAAGSQATPRTTPHTEAGSTILLIDESHIAWNDLNNARTQMLQFLAAARPDERIGLYTMNSLGFRVLAEVTTDYAAVSARLQKWMPTVQSVTQAQDEETRNRQQFNEMRSVSDLNSVNGNQIDSPDGLSPVDPQLLTMGSNPARASLIILVGVARRLGAVPGHKNLVWVSSDNVFADFRDQQVSIDQTTGTLDSFALRAQEAMNDAHVAVYPFDVSQLETSAIDAETQHRNVQLTPTNPEAGKLPTDYTAGRNKAEMLEDIHPIQWPVRQVAEATGGRAIRRSGDLAAALSEIVDDGHATYLLSFSPDQPADGQYHTITVKLSGKRHGLTLHYRTGYLYMKEPATLKERFRQAVWQPVDANELTIAAKVIPVDAGANMKINIAAGGLDVKEESERWMDDLDVFFILRDDAGLHAQVEGQTLGLRLKPLTYRQLLSTGIPYEHVVQLKRGMASLRILVVDKNSGRMGSVTIPVSAFGPDKR
ncbi:MAG: VWA domain-containing protein [Terracidiphilus sp.]|jgi:VWFA-related protein